MQMSRYHNAQIERVLDAFRTNLANNIVAGLLRTLFIALWSLLFVIPGIIKAYAYAMMPYILADNPNMSSMDALRHSERLMYGHKGDLFRLHLSFIGWLILVAVSNGPLRVRRKAFGRVSRNAWACVSCRGSAGIPQSARGSP